MVVPSDIVVVFTCELKGMFSRGDCGLAAPGWFQGVASWWFQDGSRVVPGEAFDGFRVVPGWFMNLGTTSSLSGTNLEPPWNHQKLSRNYTGTILEPPKADLKPLSNNPGTMPLEQTWSQPWKHPGTTWNALAGFWFV